MSHLISTPADRRQPCSCEEKGSHLDSELPSQEITKVNTPHIAAKLSLGAPDDPMEHEAEAVAERVMRAPAQHFVQRKCAECEQEEKLHRKETESAHPIEVGTGASVSAEISRGIEATRPGGSAMDHHTLDFMENRFGASFSEVKIHKDAASAQLAGSLSAQAFTIGKEIYFNENKYNPDSDDGKRLLAHELTHVVQQNSGINAKLIQRACHDSSNPSRPVAACPEGATNVSRQAQGDANVSDARAEAIIATASATGTNSAKAMQVVNDILCSYMPGQAAKVRNISYYAGDPGLVTQSVGSGASARGDICVGDSFLNATTRSGISRRVLQLAHELEHIDQYRSGMAGQGNHPEREFLAFYHEGLADEYIGTGRMAHSTRKRLIDAALGQYNCLSAALKTTHQSQQQDLLSRRQTVNGTNGNDPTNPPAGCVPSS